MYVYCGLCFIEGRLLLLCGFIFPLFLADSSARELTTRSRSGSANLGGATSASAGIVGDIVSADFGALCDIPSASFEMIGRLI